ncbi:Ada metal-binding domain-containing protein [Bradyrhizobium sp. Cp5.3]|uniref:Ada metal-binding domain-containing protein n=1 Tax=Bradyrhizobium sp. Cp5.3 TaxID=443598 RepID=UPI0009FC348C|nr:Ada metal-binding domain-containing protein [Bradyrhizobium sp. Cp5.3]
MAVPYKLIGADGRTYLSATPRPARGHRWLKGCGRLDCRSALRWIARGLCTRYRVFFADEATAIAAGYRPCARCLPQRYAPWRNDRAEWARTDSAARKARESSK